jgi:hypothetical protein
VNEPTKASEWRKPKIKIETEQYGTIELRRLTTEDFVYLYELEKLQLPHREFTSSLVQNQLELPLIVAPVLGWQDEVLTKVAMLWAIDNHWETQVSIPVYTAIYQGYEKVKQQHLDLMQEMANRITANLSQLNLTPFRIELPQSLINNINQASSLLQNTIRNFVEHIQASTALIAQTLTQQVFETKLTTEVRRIFDTIPRYSEIQARLQEIENTLDDTGYGFSLPILRMGDVGKIVSVTNVSPKVRSAVLTNKMLRITQSQELNNELDNLFQNSKLLKPRWKIVDSAFKAHQQREYALSVPAILPQIEGILADLLVIKELAIIENSKVYAIDKNGQKILNKNGDFIRIGGLTQLVHTSELKDDDDLGKLAEYLANQLIGDRNNILHGRNLSYNKAKLSTQTVLTLLVLATEVAYLEIKDQIS